jgi:hypothetical protein
MDLNQVITTALEAINEILAAGIVVIASSLLLYNLSRNRNNRVARTSAAVLASVTFAYIVDVFIALEPPSEVALLATRLQWLGIMYIPAALFHLSDALLATTGLPSRGRRRLVTRLLYILAGVLFGIAVLTDWIAVPIPTGSGIKMDAEFFSLFPVFGAYFVIACAATFINLNRARLRCLSASSKRRMAYLQFAILTPALGIFPYSVLLPISDELSLAVQVLINLANIIVIIMLVFLSYPLSFFGSDVPDRVVKVELLRFLLRGPGTALVALGVMVSTSRASAVFGLEGEEFMPFAVIASVLAWQWSIHLGLPNLERWLIYRDEDDESLSKLQDLSDKMLTHSDLQQLISATLESLCDFLRTQVAFVVALKNGDSELVQSTGKLPLSDEDWQVEAHDLRDLAETIARVTGRSAFVAWRDYYIVPLYSNRASNGENPLVLIGILGIETENTPTFGLDGRDTNLLYSYVERAEQTLDDILLQGDIFAALEGLLPQISTTRSRADEVEYLPARQERVHEPNREEVVEQVRAALRQYWGGAGITRSRLLDLEVVRQQLNKGETPTQALRNIIQLAIERLRPEGDRSMTATEWTLYNLVDLRFIEGKKVRDVARRMSMSEPDLYRKQRLAIEAIADEILAMETETLAH